MAFSRFNLDFSISIVLPNKLKIMSDNHIISYKTYLFILIILIAITLISVGVTYININEVTVTVALLLASVKSILVLAYFMHLKFEKKFIVFMVASVFLLFTIVTIITFLDYLYR